MASWFSFKQAVFIILFWKISVCDVDLLENLKLKRDNSPELNDFLSRVLEKKGIFKKIRDTAKRFQFDTNDTILSRKVNRNTNAYENNQFPVELTKDFKRDDVHVLGNRPVNDVFPYTSIKYLKEKVIDLPMSNKYKRRSIRNRSYTHRNKKDTEERFRRGFELNDYKSNGDFNSRYIQINPRSEMGVRNVPGNKYGQRRETLMDSHHFVSKRELPNRYAIGNTEYGSNDIYAMQDESDKIYTQPNENVKNHDESSFILNNNFEKLSPVFLKHNGDANDKQNGEVQENSDIELSNIDASQDENVKTQRRKIHFRSSPNRQQLENFVNTKIIYQNLKKDENQERKNTLTDVDEPTSAIEQYQLSTKPYIIYIPIKSSVTPPSKDSFVQNESDSSDKFPVKESKDMIHDVDFTEIPSNSRINRKNVRPTDIVANYKTQRDMQDTIDHLVHALNIANKKLMNSEYNEKRTFNGLQSYTNHLIAAENNNNLKEMHFQQRNLLYIENNTVNNSVSIDNRYGNLDYENGQRDQLSINDKKIRVKRKLPRSLHSNLENMANNYDQLKEWEDEYGEEEDSTETQKLSYNKKKNDQNHFNNRFIEIKNGEEEYATGEIDKRFEIAPDRPTCNNDTNKTTEYQNVTSTCNITQISTRSPWNKIKLKRQHDELNSPSFDNYDSKYNCEKNEDCINKCKNCNCKTCGIPTAEKNDICENCQKKLKSSQNFPYINSDTGKPYLQYNLPNGLSQGPQNNINDIDNGKTENKIEMNKEVGFEVMTPHPESSQRYPNAGHLANDYTGHPSKTSQVVPLATIAHLNKIFTKVHTKHNKNNLKEIEEDTSDLETISNINEGNGILVQQNDKWVKPLSKQRSAAQDKSFQAQALRDVLYDSTDNIASIATYSDNIVVKKRQISNGDDESSAEFSIYIDKLKRDKKHVDVPRNVIKHMLNNVESFGDVVENIASEKNINKRESGNIFVPTDGENESLARVSPNEDSKKPSEYKSNSNRRRLLKRHEKLYNSFLEYPILKNNGYYESNPYKNAAKQRRYKNSKKFRRHYNSLQKRNAESTTAQMVVSDGNIESNETKRLGRWQKHNGNPAMKEWINPANPKNCLLPKDEGRKPIEHTKSEKQSGSHIKVPSDCGQMNESLDDHAALVVIDKVFEELKNHKELSSRFHHGLSNRHNSKNEMKTLDSFRKSESGGNIKHTEQMLHNVMVVLNKMILDQVERRSCRHLSPELKHFLKIISVPKKKEIDEDKKIEEEGIPLPVVKASKGRNTKGEQPQNSFLFKNNQKETESGKDAAEIQEQIEMVQDLLSRYKKLQLNCKLKAQPVETYLKQHLEMLLQISNTLKPKAPPESHRKIKDISPFNIFTIKTIQKPYEIKSTPGFIINKNIDNNNLPLKNHPIFNVDEVFKDHLDRLKQSNNGELPWQQSYSNSNLPQFPQTQNNSKIVRKSKKFQNENDKQFSVSQQYQKLVNAADYLRKKRETKEKIGRLFSKSDANYSSTENNNTMKSDDKETLSNIEFEQLVPFNLE